MALGIPVVTTSKGAEGLDVQNSVHLLIADESVKFAEAVEELITNKDLYASLSVNGRQLVEKYYDWAKIMPKFLDIVEKVGQRKNLS